MTVLSKTTHTFDFSTECSCRWDTLQTRTIRYCWQYCQRSRQRGLRLLAVAPRCSLPLAGSRACGASWEQRVGALTAALYLTLQPPALASEAGRAGWAPQPLSVADVAGLLDFAGPDTDPSDPYTVLGDVRKKYLIEQRAGEKIVSRTKGFTVEACAEGVAIAADALQFPPNRPSPAAEEGRCQKREGAELGPACVSACRAACSNAVERYAAVARSTTGFPVADDAQARASRACSRECAYECNKPGKFYGFQISSRR